MDSVVILTCLIFINICFTKKVALEKAISNERDADIYENFLPSRFNRIEDFHKFQAMSEDAEKPTRMKHPLKITMSPHFGSSSNILLKQDNNDVENEVDLKHNQVRDLSPSEQILIIKDNKEDPIIKVVEFKPITERFPSSFQTYPTLTGLPSYNKFNSENKRISNDEGNSLKNIIENIDLNFPKKTLSKSKDIFGLNTDNLSTEKQKEFAPIEKVVHIPPIKVVKDLEPIGNNYVRTEVIDLTDNQPKSKGNSKMDEFYPFVISYDNNKGNKEINQSGKRNILKDLSDFFFQRSIPGPMIDKNSKNDEKTGPVDAVDVEDDPPVEEVVAQGSPLKKSKRESLDNNWNQDSANELVNGYDKNSLITMEEALKEMNRADLNFITRISRNVQDDPNSDYFNDENNRLRRNVIKRDGVEYYDEDDKDENNDDDEEGENNGKNLPKREIQQRNVRDLHDGFENANIVNLPRYYLDKNIVNHYVSNGNKNLERFIEERADEDLLNGAAYYYGIDRDSLNKNLLNKRSVQNENTNVARLHGGAGSTRNYMNNLRNKNQQDMLEKSRTFKKSTN